MQPAAPSATATPPAPPLALTRLLRELAAPLRVANRHKVQLHSSGPESRQHISCELRGQLPAAAKGGGAAMGEALRGVGEGSSPGPGLLRHSTSCFANSRHKGSHAGRQPYRLAARQQAQGPHGATATQNARQPSLLRTSSWAAKRQQTRGGARSARTTGVIPWSGQRPGPLGRPPGPTRPSPAPAGRQRYYCTPGKSCSCASPRSRY